MGGAASKASRSAGANASAAAKRKYPSRVPPTSTTSSAQATRTFDPAERNAQSRKPDSSTPGPSRADATAAQTAKVSSARSEEIDLDGRDPELAERLRSVGPVQIDPFHPNAQSSTSSSQRGTTPNSRFTAPNGGHSIPPTTHSAASIPHAFEGRDGGGGELPQGPAGITMAQSPALLVLRARHEAEMRATAEFENIGRPGFEGRTVMDATTLQSVLRMREKGKSAMEIEQSVGLKKGSLGLLGPRGAVTSSMA